MAFTQKLHNELNKAFGSRAMLVGQSTAIEKSMKGFVTGVVGQGNSANNMNTQENNYKNNGFSPEEGRTLQPLTLRKMYYYNPVVRLAVDTIINEVTSAQWKITPKKKDEKATEAQKAKIEEITEFFYNCNDNKDSFSSLLEMVIRDICVLDAGALEKVKKNGKLAELYAVDGSSITIEADAHRRIKGYRQWVQSKPICEYKPGEIIYMMMNPRTESLYGLPALETLHMVVSAYLHAESYNLKYFENNHIPKGILDVGPSIPEDQLDRFREFWDAETSGKPHRILILGGPMATGQEGKGVQWIPLQTNAKDMELMQYLAWLERIILACFGVTPSEVGFTENVSGAPATGQLLQSSAFKNKTVYPMMNKLANYLTQHIVFDEFKAYDLKFEFIEETSLSERLQKSQIHQLEIASGVKTVNEIRKEEGLEEVTDPNVPQVPGAQPPVGDQPPVEGDQPMGSQEQPKEQTLEEKQAEYAQETKDSKERVQITEQTGEMISQALINVRNAAELARIDKQLKDAIK